MNDYRTERATDGSVRLFRNQVLQQLLASPGMNFYALADGACYLLLNEHLLQNSEVIQWCWLLENTSLEDISQAGPVLICFNALPEKGTELLDWLIERDQHESWVSWLWSHERLEPLSHHLGRLLFTTLPDGRQALFRYYDPRVRRALESVLNVEQRAELMKPIARWQIWSPLREEYLTFSQRAGLGVIHD